MSATRRIALAATIAVSFGLTTWPAVAADKNDIKCLNAVGKAVQKASVKQLKALHKCREGNANPAAAQCPDAKAQKQLDKAQKLFGKLSKKCKEGKFDPQRAVGFTGCGSSASCASTDPSIAGYLACVDCATGESSDKTARTIGDGACGNGFRDPGEECDGETNCDASCRTIFVCGDGNVDPREECDPPGQFAPTCAEGEICSEECECAAGGGSCGDGNLDTGEECDPPGSTAACTGGDICNSRCECAPPCDCCALNPRLVESTVGIGSGVCGSLRNFRCQGGDPDFQNLACASATDCEVGPCIVGPNICTGNFTISCTSDADCVGTCQEITGPATGFPQDLLCGQLYTGGGSNSVPLPLSIPDQSSVFFDVTSCEPDGTTVLGPATASDIGGVHPERKCTEGRKCSGAGSACVLDADCPASETCDDKCLFGAPLPVPNTNSTPTSVCVINVVSDDASGTGTCDGDSETSVPLRSVIHLAGDILSTAMGPIVGGVPGVQPCPLCSAQCAGGANMNQPCAADSDCPGSTCDNTPNCIGGPNHGNTCTPETSRLNVGFPTSHDCPPLASQDITTAIGGLPIAFSLTTATEVRRGIDQPELRRTFCGFCRDVNIEGSGCFDGDPDPGMSQDCPDSSGVVDCNPKSGTTTGCGAAIPCDDDSDCTAPYESCAQRNPGAFSKASATVYSLSGSPSECLADGKAHDLTGVSAFCIPPTFDATVDAAGDLPGPGAVSLEASVKLVP